MNKKISIYTALFGTGIVAGACGMFGGGGEVIKNSSQLTSTLLVNNAYQTQAVTPCLASATTCTPEGFAGRVYAASAMLGEEANNGLGEGAYGMTFLADNADTINRPDQGKFGTLTFDLTSPSVFSGLISIPSEDQMPSSPYMPRLEIAFDYLDAKFELSGHSDTSLNTEWTIRVIMVKDGTIGDLAVTGGDLLIKQGASGTFQWCSSAGCSTTRPSSPYTLTSAVQALATAATREGNTNYAYYSVDLATPLRPTFSEISDTTRLWTIDFDIENAIQWTAAPSTFTAAKDFLANFKLPYACNYDGCDQSGGITATLTIGAANSVPATR